jgi:hypothetical protein
MRRGTLVFSLLLAALATLPSTAAAVTFGANLGRAPDNTATCITIQLFPIYGPTCSVTSNNPTTGESSFPPAGEGVVTQVRVRVGPTTGPMQIAEEEALRKDNPADPGHPTYACCKLVALSPVFTPAPNSTTAVPVNFPVKQSLTPEPSGYYVDDHLSLSVLDENVPIPATTDPGAGVGIWFPAWQSPGEERAGIYGTAGITVLLSAEWDPVPGAAPAGAGAGAPPPAPVGGAPIPLTLPKLARVRNGKALLPLVCNLTQACRGLLRLQNRRAGGGARLLARQRGKRGKRRKKRITYAKTRFRIPAGQRKIVRARLKGAGKRLLKRRRKARAWVNVSFKGSAATVPSSRVILKRKSGKRRR